MLIKRRSFLTGMMASVFAPLVVKADILMPVSALHIPKKQYVIAEGWNAGIIEAVSGTAPDWMIPLDGRLVYGRSCPDLYLAVRGRIPGEDDWLHIQHSDDHELMASNTADYWHSVGYRHRMIIAHKEA